MARIMLDIPLRTWVGISPTTQASLEALGRGEIQQANEIDRLERLAAHGTLDDVRTLAVALVLVDRLEDAAGALNHVLDREPNDHAMRLNLAMVAMRLGRYEAARQAAAQVLAATDDPNDREVAERLLEKIRAGFTAVREQNHVDRLRLERLRERVEYGEVTADEWRQLAVLLIRLRGEDPRGVLEAVEILERLETEHPGDAVIAEELASALVVAFEYVEGAELIRLSELLNGVIRRLELVHPDSWVITALRDHDSPAMARDAAPADSYEQRLEWAGHILQRAMSTGPDAAEALEELRALVGATPEDPNLRGFLMFAEAEAGNDAAALTHAQWMSQLPELPHEGHFNLVQVLWGRDRERAEHHLREAMTTARDEQERQDVRDLAARLGRPS
jgi:hypothetical protein